MVGECKDPDICKILHLVLCQFDITKVISTRYEPWTLQPFWMCWWVTQYLSISYIRILKDLRIIVQVPRDLWKSPTPIMGLKTGSFRSVFSGSCSVEFQYFRILKNREVGEWKAESWQSLWMHYPMNIQWIQITYSCK